MNKKQLPAWAVLMIITLVAALCLGATYEITKDTITQRTAAEAEATRKALLSDAAVFEEVENDQLDSLYVGKSGEGESAETVGYVGVTTVQGFAGDVEVTIGTDTSGTLTGISVGGEKFSETAGLGARAKNASFTDQFKGKTPVLKLGDSANESEIDALTSSTITSNAVVRGVNSAWNAISSYAGFASEEQVFVGAVDRNCYYCALEDGSDVYVRLTMDDEHNVTDARIGNKTSGEVVYGENVWADGKLTLGDDVKDKSAAIEGAVSTILSYVEDPYSVLTRGGNIFYTNVDGFGGLVYVELSLDETGEITGIVIGDENFSETAGLGARAKEEAFYSQYVGKKEQVALGTDIDAIAGATITSAAVTDAVNKILSYYALNGNTSGEAAVIEQKAEEPAAASTPAVEASEDGFSVTANGLTGTFDVTVSLDEKGAVSAVTLGEASTDGDAPFLNMVKNSETFLAQFTGRSGEIAEGDIDLVTGATTSSKAVLAAVNSVLAASSAPAETEAPAEEAAAEAADGETVTANGLTGTFDVTVSLDEKGAVSAVTLGEASTDGDASFLNMVKNSETFLAQLVGRSGEIAEGDIDMVTGATTSSKAVLAAVNEVLKTHAAD